MEIILDNIRSFCGRHSVELRPLTFLVGENSTGKSTFLAVLAAASDPNFPSSRPALDVPPFDLGSYDSIATYKGGRFGRSASFSIGYTHGTKKENVGAYATYKSIKGQPRLVSFWVETATARLSATFKEQSLTVQIRAKARGPKVTATVPHQPGVGLSLNSAVQAVYSTMTPADDYERFVAIMDLLEPLTGRTRRTRPLGLAYAIAPIRSKPKRTYDQTSDEFTPEGAHIPLLLARLWQQEDESEIDSILEALEAFGEDSRLLQGLWVRNLGKSPSDPFQIMVNIAGPRRNLSDVGYGVSQSLPVIVQSVMTTRSRRLLLQQPEVHLHPKAQAALGSFFGKLVAIERKQFVIETHSDYLLDRVRQDVARGLLPAKNVLILFFEREGVETSIHPIDVDKKGNLVNAPRNYRQFFLDEEMRLLGRGPK